MSGTLTFQLCSSDSLLPAQLSKAYIAKQKTKEKLGFLLHCSLQPKFFTDPYLFIAHFIPPCPQNSHISFYTTEKRTKNFLFFYSGFCFNLILWDLMFLWTLISLSSAGKFVSFQNLFTVLAYSSSFSVGFFLWWCISITLYVCVCGSWLLEVLFFFFFLEEEKWKKKKKVCGNRNDWLGGTNYLKELTLPMPCLFHKTNVYLIRPRRVWCGNFVG